MNCKLVTFHMGKKESIPVCLRAAVEALQGLRASPAPHVIPNQVSVLRMGRNMQRLEKSGWVPLLPEQKKKPPGQRHPCLLPG